MRIIPVIDVAGGVVVHARGGRRAEYQPIRSKLTSSTQPKDVARAMCFVVETRELYVADLNALEGGEPQWKVLEELIIAGFDLLVDVGVRDVERAAALARMGVRQVVVALECLPDWSVLANAIASLGAGRVAYSLDLFRGQPILAKGWRGERDVPSLTEHALDLGVATLIVLDLADVGESAGCSTLDLCRSIRSRSPSLILITGGGVRQAGDLLAIRDAGVSAVLVGTAVHEGRLKLQSASGLPNDRR